MHGNEKAPEAGQGNEGTTETQLSEGTINMNDSNTLPGLTIVDHADGDDVPGTYLTAWSQSGDDWRITVDYIGDGGSWAVYVELDPCAEAITRELMAEIAAAHEAAHQIADGLNENPITERLNAARRQREDHAAFVAALTSIDA
jgi:hypothetical protein